MTRPPRHPGRFVAMMAALLASQLAAPAASGEELPAQGWTTLHVGVLPMVSYVRSAEDLYQESASARQLRESAGLWQRRIETLVAARDQVDVLTAAHAAEKLSRAKGYREAASLAAERFALGVEHYRALQLDDALKNLKRALQLQREAYIDVVDPKVVADAELYRGLAQIEQGSADKAHIAFREMLALEPGRAFQKGYYPAETESALAGALADLAQQPDKASTRYTIRRLDALAKKLDLDYWILAYLDGTASAPYLRLAFFDRKASALSVADRIPVDDADAAALRLDRAISAWHACAVSVAPISRIRKKPPGPSWHLDVGYAHATMLRHRQTRDIFHAPGAQIGLGWAATRNLQLFGRLLVTAAISDGNRDLIDTFVTNRLVLGAGLYGGSSRLQAFVETGIELAVSYSEITLIRDVDCKWTRSLDYDSPPCDRGKIFTLKAPALWFGLAVAAGSRWFFTRDWYLNLAAGVSIYVLRVDLAAEMNFPLNLSLGIGHRF